MNFIQSMLRHSKRFVYQNRPKLRSSLSYRLTRPSHLNHYLRNWIKEQHMNWVRKVSDRKEGWCFVNHKPDGRDLIELNLNYLRIQRLSHPCINPCSLCNTDCQTWWLLNLPIFEVLYEQISKIEKVIFEISF